MVDVYVSAGSNIEPDRHLRTAYLELVKRFGPVSSSSVYRTESVGFEGDDFLNLVLAFATDESIDVISAELNRLQLLCNRTADAPPLSPRTLDLDLLLYGDQVVDGPQVHLPRSDIVKYAFVLGPMAELAPDLLHPVAQKSMRDLWTEFDRTSQVIEPLPDSPICR
jgi:2-amino-4-hydroxy-6-hydroxymethyldihydropteridine diphosphokinase